MASLRGRVAIECSGLQLLLDSRAHFLGVRREGFRKEVDGLTPPLELCKKGHSIQTLGASSTFSIATRLDLSLKPGCFCEQDVLGDAPLCVRERTQKQRCPVNPQFSTCRKA